MRPNVFGHWFCSRSARVFSRRASVLFTLCVSFIHVLSKLFLHHAPIWGMLRFLVDLGGWVGRRQAISSIPSKSKHLSNCSSTKTTSQAPSRPLSRLPILSCPPICRIRMFRRRTYRLPHHPPRFNPRCLPHFKRGGR